MRFIVYGAGAVGNVFAAALFMQGYPTVIVGNAAHVDKVCADGLNFVTPSKTHNLKIEAHKKAEELAPFSDEDVILLTAKSQHTPLCLGQLKSAGASKKSPVICCQNSIWNEPTASRAFDMVYGVVISMPVSFLKPGEVQVGSDVPFGYLEAGRYPMGVDHIVEQFVESMRKAGFDANANAEIMKAKGAKCLTNLMNAFQAITDARDAGNFGAKVREEAEAVWRASGIDWEAPEEYSKRSRPKRPAGAPAPAAATPGGGGGNKNSSWQSLARESGSIESEQLNGDIVSLGRLVGVDTRYNELLWRVSAEMAARKEKPGRYTPADLEAMIAQGKSGPMNAE